MSTTDTSTEAIPGTVDITPTWEATLPYIVAGLRRRENSKAFSEAAALLHHLASIADYHGEQERIGVEQPIPSRVPTGFLKLNIAVVRGE